MNADSAIQANLQGAAVPARRTSSSAAREWRLASRTVRFSACCLALFYLLAAASPFFASYDPTYQNREMPDCPPMSLHLSAPSDWSRGLFYTHPMHMQDPIARRFAADPSRRLDIHLFTRGHLFTTDSEREPYFMLGSDGLGRDLYSRIVYGSRVSMCVGLIGVPVLAGSAAYAFAEAMGWKSGLERSPKNARGFYAVIAISVLGFIIMLCACYWAVISYRRMNGLPAARVSFKERRPRRREGRASRRSGAGIGERLEERWRRRQEGRGN